MIASELHHDAKGLKQAYADKGWVFFTDWDDLIERAKQGHQQFRKILEERATESSKAAESAGLADGATASGDIDKGGKVKQKKKKSKK